MSTDNTDEQALLAELEQLRQENRDLKRLATNLSEAAEMSAGKETTWLFALEGNRDGVWDWNAVTNEVFFSTRWKEMLGYAEDEIGGDLSEWDSRLHPDDRSAVYADLGRHLAGETTFYANEHRLRCKDGSYLWILDRGKVISWTEDGRPLRVVGTHSDIHSRKEAELENQRLVEELSEALENVKILRGLLPICSRCKKIRDDKGYWSHVESYIERHSEAEFSHGICPDCAKELYPGYVGREGDWDLPTAEPDSH